jgi:hypothetical protein
MTDDGRTAVWRSADLRSGVHSDSSAREITRKGMPGGCRVGDRRSMRGSSQANGMGDGRVVPARRERRAFLTSYGGHCAKASGTNLVRGVCASRYVIWFGINPAFYRQVCRFTGGRSTRARKPRSQGSGRPRLISSIAECPDGASAFSPRLAQSAYLGYEETKRPTATRLWHDSSTSPKLSRSPAGHSGTSAGLAATALRLIEMDGCTPKVDAAPTLGYRPMPRWGIF